MTVHDNPRSLTLQLDGRLAGPWVQELERFWQGTPASQRRRVLRVDLRGLTGIDAAGKEFLAAAHCQGANFVTADCWTEAIVAEITGSTSSRTATTGQRSAIGGGRQRREPEHR